MSDKEIDTNPVPITLLDSYSNALQAAFSWRILYICGMPIECERQLKDMITGPPVLIHRPINDKIKEMVYASQVLNDRIEDMLYTGQVLNDN